MKDFLRGYWRENGLDRVLEDAVRRGNEAPGTGGEPFLEAAIPPDKDDLARLHWLVRSRRVFTILEFGTGFSTVVVRGHLS